MPCFASATLRHPNSECEVHLIGISHTSAYSGKLAHDAILHHKPDVVVLEVDEARLQEQAYRAQHWLHGKQRAQVVQHSVRPFVEAGSIWEALAANHDRRAAIHLSNEGSALLEGGLYGSEVILSCEAAVACGADIVAADRRRDVSQARLLAAARQEQDRIYELHTEDDWSLLLSAAAEAARRLGSAVHDCADALLRSDAEHFAERLHPVFLLASAPDYHQALLHAGCEQPAAVVDALNRLMTHSARSGSKVDLDDLALVQTFIERIEHHKHRMRQHVFAHLEHSAPCGLAAAATTSDAPPACCSDCRDGHSNHVCADAAGAQHTDNTARTRLEVAPLLPRFGCEWAAEAQATVLRGCEGDDADCVSSLRSCAEARSGAAALEAAQPLMPGLTAAAEHLETRGERLRASLRATFDAWLFNDGQKRLQPHAHDPFYQWCWRGVGHMHSFRLRDHVSNLHGSVGAAHPDGMSPYYRTAVYERDAVLTHRLWHQAAQPGRKCVVAVVGANHLPGIVRNWDCAGGEQMAGRVREYLSMPARTTRQGEHEWKRGVVGGVAIALEGCAVAALAYVPVRFAARRARVGAVGLRTLSMLPLAALSGLAVGAALSDVSRQSRVAHLVRNIAACADDADSCAR